jgi:signal transduction histidine kinase
MIDDRQVNTSVFASDSDILTFLTTFGRQLDEVTDAHKLHATIIDAFRHVARSSSAALWTVDSRCGEYQRQAWLGSDCDFLPAALPESPALSRILFSNADILGRDEAERRCPPEAASILDGILGAGHFNVIVPLRSQGLLVGFCTMMLSDCGNLPKAAFADPLLLTVQMSAGALQRRLSKDAVRCSQALLRRTDRLRSLEIIAGGFAHEIRNPLTSIKTFVQLAPERREDARFIQEFSRLAVQDIHRIERLLEEIIDYTRCIVPSPMEEDVNELVSSCLSFIAVKASSRSIHVRTVFAEGLPLLSLDRQQIKQALINLLLNAMEAAQEHGKEIVVRTFLGQRPGGGSGVYIEVRDNGRGIPAEHLDHIFDPFFTTEHSNGAGDIRGLGLTIAHQIVREHQGDLTVESREGAGSTFCLVLPIGVPHLQSSHTGAS